MDEIVQISKKYKEKLQKDGLSDDEVIKKTEEFIFFALKLYNANKNLKDEEFIKVVESQMSQTRLKK